MRKPFVHILAVSIAAVVVGTSAHAATIYALSPSAVGAGTLLRFDSATPASVTPLVITGTSTPIVDIDFYPVNGVLYGIASNGNTFGIDTATGLATLRVTPLTALSNITDMDFNPAADRMRLFGDTDRNYRMVPDVVTGAAATPGTVLDDGTFTDTARQLVSSAYSNNFDGATATTLFSIDTTQDALLSHTGGPEFNGTTQVGPLGVAVGTAVGFDIGQDGVAYLSNGNNFYTVNLTTGSATLVGVIGGATGAPVTSIAAQAVPEPSTALLGLLGLGLLARRRRTA